MNKSEAEWKHCLSPEQFAILRKKETEPAFTGKYYNQHEAGQYVCAGCQAILFNSQNKFDSGTGWPSFWKTANDKAVRSEKDPSYGMNRVEVLCVNCGGHLGHLFDDGPAPTHLRYCINSAALDFKHEK